jgi:hypothetical protein
MMDRGIEIDLSQHLGPVFLLLLYIVESRHLVVIYGRLPL